MQVLPHAFPLRQTLQQSPAAHSGAAAPVASESASAIIQTFIGNPPDEYVVDPPRQLNFSVC